MDEVSLKYGELDQWKLNQQKTEEENMLHYKQREEENENTIQ